MPSIPLKRTSTADRSVSPPPTKRRAMPTVVTNTSNSTTGCSAPKIASTTTSKAVSNFFARPSEKAPEKALWTSKGDSLFMCKYDKLDDNAHIKPRKIALFDFDSTLIVAKSGKKFAKEAGDWTFWHASVPSKLKQLVEDGYLVNIISNQAGLKPPDPKTKSPVGALNKKVAEWKQKVKAVLDTLDLPIAVYAARDHDLYRKPRVGMWEQLLADHHLSADDVNLDESIFVGDAAGRTASSKGNRDFSCSDRDFASNVGIPFKTPEEYFLNEEPRPFARAFEPKQYLKTVNDTDTDSSPIVYTRRNPQDMILFVGSPGAGKSTFYHRHLKPLGYERINQDTLGSRDRCLRLATTHLTAGLSVAIDNTNADLDVRSHWLALAKQFSVPIRCVHFTAPSKLCEHNDTVRALVGGSMNPEKRSMLPKMAFSGFAGRYREPTVREGFQDVVKVEFRFEGADEERRVWGRYWL
ncbi:Bifunctional polynucleotide phosphatase/kinase [Sphaceloma murrayae]|uniref:Bifunctional polynucleotide phosphatase/kinase n=1 Tax=Sphaceloma murrayae TaxID=2082308 RepID=A0A2K1QQN4_9PEZI|nr:Bifunctional polynucleotide phosphatase/kinase [Sphaceloma murrayae]